jgi:hypothetical protein
MAKRPRNPDRPEEKDSAAPPPHLWVTNEEVATNGFEMPAVERVVREKRSSLARRLCTDDIRDFFQSVLETHVTPTAVAYLLSLDAKALHRTLEEYQADLEARGVTRAMVNRRLAVARRLVRPRLTLEAEYRVADGEGVVPSSPSGLEPRAT